MTIVLASAALLLSFQAQPGVEEDASSPDTQATEAATAVPAQLAASEDDKITCKRTAITGSKFKKKICGTKKDWELMAKRAEETTREFQGRGTGNEPIR